MLSPLTELLLAHARSRTPAEAAELILAEVGGTRSPAEVLRGLAAAVQKEVGQCWQRNVLSTADEHLASEVIGEVVTTLSRAPVPDPDRGRIVLVCAEGDRHTLPTRMAGLLLRWDGWRVTPLGGPLPADDLAEWLPTVRPDAVAISCTVPQFLPGVLRMADAATLAGVPSVVGGAGLGVDRTRAAGLGLRWAGTPEAVAAALAAPPADLDLVALDARRQAFDEIDSIVGSTVEAACIRLSLDSTEAREFTGERWARIRRDLDGTMRALAASVLCGDPDLFDDHLTWLDLLLTGRGQPAGLVSSYVTALASVLPRRSTALAERLRRAAALPPPAARRG